MVEETMTVEQQITKLLSNGFTGGKYAENCIYADTPTKDETAALQRLFPGAVIKRHVCSGITVIIL